MNRFGIIRLRARYDETQEQFAERMGVSRSTIINWEKGHKEPTRLAREKLQMLEDKLNRGLNEEQR